MYTDWIRIHVFITITGGMEYEKKNFVFGFVFGVGICSDYRGTGWYNIGFLIGKKKYMV